MTCSKEHNALFSIAGVVEIFKAALQQLIPCSKLLIAKLVDDQFVKKFPLFHGTNPKAYCHVYNSSPLILILCQINPFRTLPSYFFIFGFNIILPSTPTSSKWCFLQVFVENVCLIYFSDACYMPRPSHSLVNSTDYNFFVNHLLPAACCFNFLMSRYSRHPWTQVHGLHLMWEAKFRSHVKQAHL